MHEQAGPWTPACGGNSICRPLPAIRSLVELRSYEQHAGAGRGCGNPLNLGRETYLHLLRAAVWLGLSSYRANVLRSAFASATRRSTDNQYAFTTPLRSNRTRLRPPAMRYLRYKVARPHGDWDSGRPEHRRFAGGTGYASPVRRTRSWTSTSSSRMWNRGTLPFSVRCPKSFCPGGRHMGIMALKFRWPIT